jgi:prolipoprotein diacylglyceryltransferase
MDFPHYLNIAGQQIHPHPVFEMLAYFSAFQLFLYLRKRWDSYSTRQGPSPVVPFNLQIALLFACGFGAFFGSKVLAWLESPSHFWLHKHELAAWTGGKTIVGGLLGGWAGIEIAKKAVGIRDSTGDLVVFPLILAIAVGRIGCFLTGLEDHTHGDATSAVFGIDFGDGIRRHPTQLYEIGFMAILALFFWIRLRTRFRNGELFRTFMLLYLAFRFSIDFLKPSERPLGLSAIQIASLIGALYSGWQLYSMRREKAS